MVVTSQVTEHGVVLNKTSSMTSNVTIIRTNNYTLLDKILKTSSDKSVYMITRFTKHRKVMNFSVIYKQLLSLSKQIADVDPMQKRSNSIIKGQFKTYLMTNTFTNLGVGRLKCTELSSEVIDLGTYIRERIILRNETIILSDRLIISDGTIKCFLHESRLEGLTCLNTIKHWAVATGLALANVPETNELKNLLSANIHPSERQVFYLTVNISHIALTKNPEGYVICDGTFNSTENTEFSDMLHGKYFDHLSMINYKIIDALWNKVLNLQHVFLLLTSASSRFSTIPQKNQCDFIANSVTDCFKATDNTVSSWSTYFAVAKSDYVNVDILISGILQKAITNCKSSPSNEFTRKVYFNLLALRKSVISVIESHGFSGMGKSSTLRMLIAEENTAKDVEMCFNQLVDSKLGYTRLVFFANAIYNFKVNFVANFDNLGYKLSFMGDSLQYESIYRQYVPDSKIRVRRWFFSDAIGSITGLATQDEYDILSKNQVNIVSQEEKDAVEIQHLDLKTNELLDAMRQQNIKVLALYKDEAKLHGSLQSLLKDETELTVKLTHFSKALEAMSDVSLEYASIMSAISIIPNLISDIETQLNSVLSQNIVASLLPENIISSNINNYGIATLSGVTIDTEVSTDYYIVYRVPHIIDEYRIYSLDTIPFVIGNSSFHRIKLEANLIAMNSLGYSFVYEEDKCLSKFSRIFCEVSHVVISVTQNTCVSALAFNRRKIPDICKEKMEIIVPKKQMYLHHSSLPVISFFTPYKDDITYNCDFHDAGEYTKVLSIPLGISMLNIPRGCIVFSRELLIYPNVYDSIDEHLEPSVWNFDISAEVYELSNDLESIHNINTTELYSDFVDFANEVNIESMDVQKVQSEIDKFNSVKNLQEFSFTKIDLGNAHKGVTSVLGMLSIIMVVILCVVATKVFCCNGCTNCICAPFKLLYYICEYMYRGIRYLLKCNSNTHDIHDTPQDIPMSRTNDNLKVATDAIWEIQVINSRVLLTTTLRSGILFWNYLKGVIENEDSTIIKGLNIDPDLEVVNNYLRMLNRMPPPELDGSGFLKENSSIRFDKNEHEYVHVSGRIVYGFSKP
jgi:hypothetical protein